MRGASCEIRVASAVAMAMSAALRSAGNIVSRRAMAVFRSCFRWASMGFKAGTFEIALYAILLSRTMRNNFV